MNSAERNAFPVPRSVCVDCEANLQILAALTFPLVLKPADKTLVLKGMAERAVIASTFDEAKALGARMLRGVPRFIAQEWIDGADTEIFFSLFSCNSKGAIVSFFPGRKLVCFPPAIGGTAVCIAAPEVARELEDLTNAFVTRAGYRGIGSLEFKRDASSGRFIIIEPTVGRTDWQEEIATLCGVNVPLSTYFSELNIAAQKAGRTLLPSAWRSSAGIRATVPVGTTVIDGYFRWSDPLPAVWYYGFETRLAPYWRKLSGR